MVGHNGVWRCLRGTASTRASNASPRRWLRRAVRAAQRRPSRSGTSKSERPGELVGIDCFYVGRLRGTKGAIWQLTAIDVASSFAWAGLISCPQGNPTGPPDLQARPTRRQRLKQQPAGSSSACSATTAASSPNDFPHHAHLKPTPDTFIRAGRPQTNGHVEALHRTILEECWRPAFARYLHARFTGLKQDLQQYTDYYNNDRTHHGRLTRGRIPADIVYGARKMETR